MALAASVLRYVSCNTAGAWPAWLGLGEFSLI
jgi:hypothetical protein